MVSKLAAVDGDLWTRHGLWGREADGGCRPQEMQGKIRGIWRWVDIARGRPDSRLGSQCGPMDSSRLSGKGAMRQELYSPSIAAPSGAWAPLETAALKWSIPDFLRRLYRCLGAPLASFCPCLTLPPCRFDVGHGRGVIDAVRLCSVRCSVRANFHNVRPSSGCRSCLSSATKFVRSLTQPKSALYLSLSRTARGDYDRLPNE